MNKILILDNDIDNLFRLHKLLKNEFHEYEILEAHSSELGIEIAKKERPVLILLEINMPILNGFEVLQLLKADEQTKSIPVVILTHLKNDVENRVKAHQMGALSFFPNHLLSEN